MHVDHKQCYLVHFYCVVLKSELRVEAKRFIAVHISCVIASAPTRVLSAAFSRYVVAAGLVSLMKVFVALAKPFSYAFALGPTPCRGYQMRLMQMERELEFVRSERDRNRMYLSRIMREVDQKVQYALKRNIDTSMIPQTPVTTSPSLCLFWLSPAA